jgi:hypothetical protein
MNASDGSNLRRLTEVTEEPSKDVFPAWMPSEEDGSLGLFGIVLRGEIWLRH